LPLINFERLCEEVRFDGVVGPAAGEKIVRVVKRVLEGEKVVDLKGSEHDKPDLTLPRLQPSPVVSVIPINYGCLGSCAYCCVVFARGRLRSHSIHEIIERLQEDLALGLQEFWLTSQDTACFGRDARTNLAELLEALCKISGDFRIRVGMMTPNTALDILDELVQAFQNDKVFKFLHLPVQSGDDQVLENMRRSYAVRDFKKAVSTFKATFPEMTLATDVICGFPGESKEAFERTLQLVEEVKPDVVNISKFFARPRTAAFEMKKDFVPVEEIRRRSRMAAELAKKVALERNRSWAGWAGEVLVDEKGKVKDSWVGRNFAYKPVALKSSDSLIGKTLRARVVNVFPTYLQGEVVE
jgi:MiaB-like tRNA modifying enzyme